MLSTLAGWQSMRFSATSAAAVTCAIMKPELTPLSGVRNGGRPLNFGSMSSARRRSASEPTSAQASARMSAANATGSAWKFPPESASPASGKMSGLSVTAFASTASVAACWVMRSRHAPITCGWQRLAVTADLPEAEHGERQGRKRGEIAGGADRPLRRHAGRETGVDEPLEKAHQLDAHPGESLQQARELQHQRQAHDRLIERRADPGAVREDDVPLQERSLRRGDAGVGRQPKPATSPYAGGC